MTTRRRRPALGWPVTDEDRAWLDRLRGDAAALRATLDAGPGGAALDALRAELAAVLGDAATGGGNGAAGGEGSGGT